MENEMKNELQLKVSKLS